jgi:peptidyl-Lys metalloendopeptidase
MVEQSLRDERLLLIRARWSVLRWGPRDRLLFAKWFGTTAPVARQAILVRLNRELALNARYSAANFTVHTPLRANVLASVNPANPGTIYIDAAFFTAPRIGFDSRGGTLVHEMSHFTIISATKDRAYGVSNCLALARKSALDALTNADNFSYYTEDAAR